MSTKTSVFETAAVTVAGYRFPIEYVITEINEFNWRLSPSFFGTADGQYNMWPLLNTMFHQQFSTIVEAQLLHHHAEVQRATQYAADMQYDPDDIPF